MTTIRSRVRTLVCVVALAGLTVFTLSGCNPGTAVAASTGSPSAPTSTPTAEPEVESPAPPTPVEVDPASFAFVLVDQTLLEQLGEVPNGVHFLVPEAELACSLWTGTFGTASGQDFIGMRWGCHKAGVHWPTEMEPPDLSLCVEGQACPVNGVRADGDAPAAGFVVGDVVFPSQWGRDPAAASIATLGDHQRVTTGEVTCSRSGLEVTCENSASGHGFTASGVAASWW